MLRNFEVTLHLRKLQNFITIKSEHTRQIRPFKQIFHGNSLLDVLGFHKQVVFKNMQELCEKKIRELSDALVSGLTI